MRVFPIGVGTAFGRRFLNTNFIVELGDKEFLMVDCGITASRSLEAMGRSVLDVKNLFVSHLHADHIGGIEELALKSKLVLGRKVNLFIHGGLVDGLWCSIQGGLEFTQLGRLRLDDYFSVFQYNDRFSCNGVAFSSYPTNHIEGMLSFDIGFGNVLLTSDTVFSRDYALGRAQDFETVVHDCSFNSIQKVHTFYQDLLDNRSMFRRLWIVHYEDSIEEYEPQVLAAGIDICRQYTEIA